MIARDYSGISAAPEAKLHNNFEHLWGVSERSHPKFGKPVPVGLSDQVKTRVARYREFQLSNVNCRITAENTKSGLVMKHRLKAWRIKFVSITSQRQENIAHCMNYERIFIPLSLFPCHLYFIEDSRQKESHNRNAL
ncbi:uncharacterized protein LOC116850423 [Odontomachus brunneus]|uniref:uncharacterized protein LOC116850423 n=1 Tax=Odontomachus brunneus TaxID=486640 RepID=UPI0013F1E75E|nr:uncharacterized protein LOC116850423 [Odontomachus brunneus]